ncbi:secretion protein [Chryseobacterium sp. T16E-39]|uniref:T9SS type A sorting domain-containing protein n=1 Tax=Chryseobacterium sp. T16E-39 TaxID=2015076 RepID=UPI000B5B17D0|nr:T9SS type A sorting domain-containing protein [Chryseobacterium sp. T16E-39]ASK30818.1 secretion protein [Chryseobacterium sp. T16E-39]
MKKTLYLLFFILNSFFIDAQAPSIEWQKTLGGSLTDWGYSVRQTADGGYITAGYTSSFNGDVTGNHGNGDFWIVKLNMTGGIQWQKSLGGTGYEIAYSIKQTTDGGYIVAGISDSNNGDVTGNHGSQDYWIVKLDPDGNIQWQKSLGGSGSEKALSIQQTTDGGYIVAGSSGSTNGDVTGNHGNLDYWIVKLNNSGDIQWQKSLGGTGLEDVAEIQQTNDGGFIVIGSSNSSSDGDVTGNHGKYDYWTVKLDILGNIQWQKSYGGIGDDFAYSIQQTVDGGYIIAGTSADSVTGDIPTYPGIPDYWIIKVDSNGNMEWNKLLGGSLRDTTQVIRQTQDGGYIVAGWTISIDGQVTENHGNNDFWVAKLDHVGNLKWQKSLGGSNSENLHSLEQTADGGYIILGDTSSTNGDVTGNHGIIDCWLVKLSSNLLNTTENQSIKKPDLYPNPAKDYVYLDNLPNGTIVSITDMSGRKLFTQKYTDRKISIHTIQFINGVYMIQVEHKGQSILSEKLIINK